MTTKPKTVSGAVMEAAFNYAELDVQDAEFLRAKAAYINARSHITHQLMTEMGNALLEAKERLPGVFLRWARSEFNISDDTIENWMNVAKRLPALPTDTPAPIQARALHLLTRETTSDSVREEAQRLAESGQVIDYQTAYILAQAPPELKVRYLSEELPKAAAFGLAQVFNRKTLSPEVKQVCIDQKVSSPELVSYLDEAYRDYARTEGTTRERLTYKDIEADGWQLNGIGWSVKLSDARPVDIERYKVDRAAMHKDNSPKRYLWLQTETPIREAPDGRLYIALEKADFNRLAVGDLLLVQIRLPVEEQ